MLYYTNGSYRVFCWSFMWMKCSKIEEVSIWGKGGEARAQAWGCPRHPKWIFKETQASKFGDALEGIPSFFNKYRYVFGFVSFMRYVQVLERLLHLGFYFCFYAPCWYEIVHGWFIECSLHFTYIFWVWLYRMLHVLRLYHLKFGLPVSLHIDNRHL